MHHHPSRSDDLAVRLLAAASAAGSDSRAAMLVLERFDTMLSKLAGEIGSRSLIVRAMALARRDFPWLKVYRISEREGLSMDMDLTAWPDTPARLEGEVALVARLLELLRTFIGARLTQQLVQEAWPELDLRDEFILKDPIP